MRVKLRSSSIALGAIGLMWVAGAGAGVDRPATRPAHEAVHSEKLIQFPTRDAEGHMRWKSFEQMHEYFVTGFISSDGFGLARMPTPRQMARRSTLYFDGVDFRIGNVQLLSTPAEEKPFIYETKSDVTMKAISDAGRRDLRACETDAVAQLKAGRDAVMTMDHGQPVVIGALRAGDECASCHQVKKGEMLGAFVYPLVPVEDVQAQRLMPTSRPSKAAVK